MTDYIEREAAIDAISEWLMKALHPENMSVYNEGERAAYRTAISEIAELPAADVRPVVKETWIVKEMQELFYGMGEHPVFVCSGCGYQIYDLLDNVKERFHFCPNCGADMRGEAE